MLDPKSPAHSSCPRSDGMTIRAEIASRALQGLLADPNAFEADTDDKMAEAYAKAAVRYADALIAELNKAP